MSAPVLGSDAPSQQNVHAATTTATPSSPPRPGILSLMRMIQRQKMQQYGLGEDYDQEWDLFCVLCEMLRTIIMNKMGCEAPHEVDHFEKSYSSLTSDADRVNFIISHPDISCILKYFAREFCSLKQEFGQAFAKSDEIAESYREQGIRLFREEKYIQAAQKYSQVNERSTLSLPLIEGPLAWNTSPHDDSAPCQCTAFLQDLSCSLSDEHNKSGG